MGVSVCMCVCVRAGAGKADADARTLAVPEMVLLSGVVTLICKKMAMLMRKPAPAVTVMTDQNSNDPKKYVTSSLDKNSNWGSSRSERGRANIVPGKRVSERAGTSCRHSERTAPCRT